MDKSACDISITLDMESSKMQRQLRAIAKHTEALANELAGIDKEVCLKCGSADVEIVKAYGDGELQEVAYDCYSCGYRAEDG